MTSQQELFYAELSSLCGDLKSLSINARRAECVRFI